MRTLFCLLVLSALLPAQEGGPDTGKPAAIPTAEKNKLTGLLPGAPGFSGTAKGPAKFYSSDLRRYVTTGADAYFDYGLVALIHREFKDGPVDVTVDIYDMGDALRAFGIYSAERSPSNLFIPMGAEGHVDLGVMDFLQGNFYVKLQATGDNDKTPSVLEMAAKNIVSRIGPEGTVPQPVAWFPAEGLVAESTTYLVKAPLGFDCLAPATTVVYRFDDKETTVLASRAPNAQEAASRVANVKTHLAAKAPVTAVEAAPGEIWRSGDTMVFARGSWVVLLKNPPDKPDVLLKELLSSVKD